MKHYQLDININQAQVARVDKKLHKTESIAGKKVKYKTKNYRI